MHRDLYLEALKRIGELELDGRSLQKLISSMEGMKVTMVQTYFTTVLNNIFSMIKSSYVMVNVFLFIQTEFSNLWHRGCTH